MRQPHPLSSPVPRLLRPLLRRLERSLTGPTDPATPNAPDRPIFLLGLPGAGIELLGPALTAHPGTGYLNHAMNRYPEHPAGIERLRRRLGLGCRLQLDREHPGLRPEDPSPGLCLWSQWLGADPFSPAAPDTDAWGPAQGARLRHDLHGILHGQAPPGRRFVSTAWFLTPWIEALDRLLPQARFLHVLRDPREAVPAYAAYCRRLDAWQRRFDWYRRDVTQTSSSPLLPYPRVPRLPEYLRQYESLDPRLLAHLWRDTQALADAATDRGLAVLTLRFEDLLEHPEQTWQSVLSFCELEPAPLAADWSRLPGARRYAALPNSPWPARIEQICAPGMRHHGYLLSSVNDTP